MQNADMYVVGLALLLTAGCIDKPAPWTPGAGDADVGTGDQRSADGKGEIGVNPLDGKIDLPAPVDIVDVVGNEVVPLDVPDLADGIVPDAEDTAELLDGMEFQDAPVLDAEVHWDLGDDAEAVVDVDVPCIPDCDGKECGDDGCEGECGDCPENDPCNAVCEDGQCVPSEVGDEICGNGVDEDCDGEDLYCEEPVGMVHATGCYIDQYEASDCEGVACSEAAGTPWTSVAFDEAGLACMKRSSRLCSIEEWQVACAGEEGNTYPYGNLYQGSLCNTESGKVDPSGTWIDCVTDAGVYDLSGNAAEWVLDEQGLPALAGGNCTAGAKGKCSYADPVDGSSTSSKTGFRCCMKWDDDLDGDDYVNSADCNDFNPGINPGEAELCDGFDNDCNGETDEGFDGDGDGVASCFDCDDENKLAFPGAQETCDGIDNNCSGEIDEGGDALCDDGDACNGLETCDDDACQPGQAPDCDDQNPCTDDSCDKQEGCIHANNTAECDDQNVCTLGDLCADGVCVPGGQALECDDGNPCTTDSCNSETGCINSNVENDTPCSDTPQWVCKDGECLCQPACDGKECGDDGCDGVCGSCPGLQDVCIEGTCVCEPQCDGKECGDDGCEGSCGECEGELVCDNGICIGCGDSICNEDEGETCETCPDDCGECSLECDPPCAPALEECIQPGAGGPVCAATMVPVTAGDFYQGCNTTLDGKCSCPGGQECNLHKVTTDAYGIEVTEVTNAQYVSFLNNNGNSCEGGNCVDAASGFVQVGEIAGVWSVIDGKEDYPMIEVTWDGATAYCEWRCPNCRLCSESEWEKAARGGCEFYVDCPGESRVWPWGNTPPASCDGQTAVYHNCNCSGKACPVGTHPDGISPYQVLDLAGNVEEWVADSRHNNYMGAPTNGTAWFDAGDSYRMSRGGTYAGTDYQMRVSSRNNHNKAGCEPSLGLRCCRSPEE